jgi:hypothetical protein
MSACREPLRIGHGDWESQNFRWAGERVVAVHDWDSVIAQPEVAIAGLAAAVWPAAGEPGQAATVEQSAGFITCYQAAAGAAAPARPPPRPSAARSPAPDPARITPPALTQDLRR